MKRLAAVAATFLSFLVVSLVPIEDTRVPWLWSPTVAQTPQDPSHEFAVLPGIQTTDTSLYLRQGSHETGVSLAQDEDSGEGTNARIADRALGPGTYTIEATTYQAHAEGSFTLRLVTGGVVAPLRNGNGWGPPAGECTEQLGTVDGTVTVTGRWDGRCSSVDKPGHYARFYTFTLDQQSAVTIDLVPWLDPDRAPINLTVTCGWHSACPGGRTTDGWAIDMSAVATTDVWSAFRHVDGDQALKVSTYVADPDKEVCQKVVAEFRADELIATVRYTHIIGLKDEDGDFLPIADRTVDASTKGLHAIRIGHIASAEEEKKCKDAGLWEGAHLHQEVTPHSDAVRSSCDDEGDVYCNRNDSETRLGVPALDFGACVSSSTWLWKIASDAPDVTATDTPTWDCPPMNLSHATDPADSGALRLAFTAAYRDTYPTDANNDPYYFKTPRVGRFELYRADGPTAFCDADASDCLPVSTATSVAPMDGVDYEDYEPEPVSFGGLVVGDWYQARGAGCIGTAPALSCGSWSGFSAPVRLLPPPLTNLVLTEKKYADQLSLSYEASDPLVTYRFDLYASDDPTVFCEPDPALECRPVATADVVSSPVLFSGLAAGRSYQARGSTCEFDVLLNLLICHPTNAKSPPLFLRNLYPEWDYLFDLFTSPSSSEYRSYTAVVNQPTTWELPELESHSEAVYGLEDAAGGGGSQARSPARTASLPPGLTFDAETRTIGGRRRQSRRPATTCSQRPTRTARRRPCASRSRSSGRHCPEVTIERSSRTPERVTEGTTLEFTLTLDRAAPADLPVAVKLVTSPSGADVYQGAAERPVTFLATSMTASLSVDTDDDGTREDAAHVVATITGSTAYTIGSPGSAAVTVEDNDSDTPTPEAMLVLSPASIAENGGSSTVTATLSHAAPAGGASLTVSASGGSGYTLSSTRTLSFAAGQTASTGTVTITATHDSDTSNESVTVSATATGGITAPAAVTLTIVDDDTPTPRATLALSPASIAENGGSSTVTATLSHAAPAGGASLTVSASGGSGYTLSSTRTLSFAAGQTASTGTVTITATHDSDTSNESVTVSATATGGITAPAAVTLTIVDDDTPTPRATLALSPASIAENGEAAPSPRRCRTLPRREGRA